jgi:hypothetical protein
MGNVWLVLTRAAEPATAEVKASGWSTSLTRWAGVGLRIAPRLSAYGARLWPHLTLRFAVLAPFGKGSLDPVAATPASSRRSAIAEAKARIGCFDLGHKLENVLAARSVYRRGHERSTRRSAILLSMGKPSASLRLYRSTPDESLWLIWFVAGAFVPAPSADS